MYGLFGLLPTSGENFISTAPLEIYLLRKMVMCLILMVPAVFGTSVALLLTEHTGVSGSSAGQKERERAEICGQQRQPIRGQQQQR